MPVINRVRDDGFGLQFHAARVELDDQPVNQHETKVVTVISIFVSRISETDDYVSVGLILNEVEGCHVSGASYQVSGAAELNQNAEENKKKNDDQRTALNVRMNFIRLHFNGIGRKRSRRGKYWRRCRSWRCNYNDRR